MEATVIAMNCGFLPVVTVIGIFGNALTLYVFYKERKKTSTIYLLLGLSLADELCMLGQIFYVVIQFRNFYFKKQLPYLNVNAFFLIRLTFTLESVSKILTVVIVIERCLAVFQPFKVQIICSNRTSVPLIVCIYVFVLTSCSVELVHLNIMGDNSSVSTYQMALVTLSENGSFFEQYVSVLQILYSILPVVLILFGNIAIFVGIRKNAKNLQYITNQRELGRMQKQQKVTRMLLTMSVIYVVCCLPKDVSHVIMMCDKSGMIVFEDNYFFQIILLFSYCLTVLNNAINFLIYAFTTDSMRQKYVSAIFRRHRYRTVILLHQC